MKFDFRRETGKQERHIPSFLGYRASYYIETDLLLRRNLAGKLESVLERLAASFVDRQYGEEIEKETVRILKTISNLKEEVSPPGDDLRVRFLSDRDEEHLLDVDLALLDKADSLHNLLDAMELVSSELEVRGTLMLLLDELMEVDRLYRRRWHILYEGDFLVP